jgi:hypothetical protein
VWRRQPGTAGSGHAPRYTKTSQWLRSRRSSKAANVGERAAPSRNRRDSAAVPGLTRVGVIAGSNAPIGAGPARRPNATSTPIAPHVTMPSPAFTDARSA